MCKTTLLIQLLIIVHFINIMTPDFLFLSVLSNGNVMIFFKVYEMLTKSKYNMYQVRYNNIDAYVLMLNMMVILLRFGFSK